MEFSFSADNQKLSVILAGHLDASAGTFFQTISAELRKTGCAHLILDCKGVDAINSVGVSAWYNFVKSEKKRTKISYYNCPQIMFDVTSIVPDIFSAKEIETIFVNYFCSACVQRTQRLFSAKDLLVLDNLPNDHCPKCNELVPAEEDFESILEYIK